MHTRISHLALAGAALALTATPAFALEATGFADKLVEVSRFMGVSLDYGSATAEGDTITLANFTLAVPGEDLVVIPGEIVFEGVVETPDGGYTAERATIADIAFTDEDEGITLTFVDILAEGISLPAEITMDTMIDVSMDLYDRVSAGPLTVAKEDGTELFAIDTMEAWVENAAADGGITTGYRIAGVRADLSAFDDAEAQEVISAFGIAQFGAELSGEGTWWPDTGRAEMTDMSIVLDELGSLSMNFAVEGYTRELYRELMKINLKMAELSEAGEEIDEAQMERLSQSMLAEFAALKLDSASIRYNDASLFMKALDFAAAEQGLDGATFAQGLKFTVPMLLAELDNANFSEMVSGAVNAFIDDPQNFEIAAEPAQPVGVEEFMGVEDDPMLLIDLLNLQVRANQ
ncbi:hypothetical protein [Pelagibacterium xiamenense]|uniref:hypothetical protein n=1 Tax=Pelagibacterium xiamenense TaxID=2901140 RepID=UPI001E29D2A0|nr:hypothetical protein [Pelagibacterium xiamenense]MCD7058895.1 hypothetical protein [Pelagibacterium xiamenense]